MKDLAQHLRFAFSLDSLAAGKAEVSGGLEGGGDGKRSHSSAVAGSLPSRKGMMVSASGFPLPWPLQVSLRLVLCDRGVGGIALAVWGVF